MRLLILLEKTKKGKFGRGQTYSLYMPNGGEDGVLIGWRTDWPENKYVEFRGPPYSQWKGEGSDFELVHDALEGRHSTVLHTNDILDVLPTHPRYDLIKNAIDNDVIPPQTPGYAFETLSEEVVPFTKQWAPSDIALTKIWQIVQALIKKGMGDELNGLFDNFKFAIQQYNELAAERSQHSELAELSDRHLHQIYEYGKKVHWQPLSRAGFKARQRMIAQSWGKEVTEGILDALPPGARKLATGLAMMAALSGAQGHESDFEHPPKHPTINRAAVYSERLSMMADIISAENPDRYGQWISNLYDVYQNDPNSFKRMFGTEYEEFLGKARNSSPQEMGAYMKAMAKSQ